MNDDDEWKASNNDQCHRTNDQWQIVIFEIYASDPLLSSLINVHVRWKGFVI